MVLRRLKIGILACCLLPRKLLGRGRHFLSVGRSGFLFRSRLRFHSIRSVEAGMAAVHFFVHHGAIDVGVVNDVRIHAGHSGVVAEGVSFPTAAPVAISPIAVTVVDSAVKADSRAPVALIKRVNAIIPAPPRRSPEQTHCWRSDPNAWDQIIIAVAPRPVFGSPNVAFNRTRWLLDYRQNRRSNIDRYVDLCDRGCQRQRDKQKPNQNKET